MLSWFIDWLKKCRKEKSASFLRFCAGKDADRMMCRYTGFFFGLFLSEFILGRMARQDLWRVKRGCRFLSVNSRRRKIDMSINGRSSDLFRSSAPSHSGGRQWERLLNLVSRRSNGFDADAVFSHCSVRRNLQQRALSRIRTGFPIKLFWP